MIQIDTTHFVSAKHSYRWDYHIKAFFSCFQAHCLL